MNEYSLSPQSFDSNLTIPSNVSIVKSPQPKYLLFLQYNLKKYEKDIDIEKIFELEKEKMIKLF